MIEVERSVMTNEERKEKIRARYKGVDRDLLEVIPAIKQASFHEDNSEKRVAVYARVLPVIRIRLHLTSFKKTTMKIWFHVILGGIWCASMQMKVFPVLH